MRIHRLDGETLALEEMDDFCRDLLAQIPESADPAGSEAAEHRLYPPPTDGADEEADEEWIEYVRPELQCFFEDATAVVQADLKAFPANPKQDSHSLHLPMKNLDAWIHALNQARLALTARYDFSPAEIDQPVQLDVGKRGLALFQVHFYGLLQDFFLRQLEYDE